MGRRANEERLQLLSEIIRSQPGLRPADLADYLSWHRSTVMRTLPILEERGILLAEDDAGRLAHYDPKSE